MPKRKFIKVCDKAYCDYVPCVEERIAQLEEQGLDSGDMRRWLGELSAQDDRARESEAEWLATLDSFQRSL